MLKIVMYISVLIGLSALALGRLVFFTAAAVGSEQNDGSGVLAIGDTVPDETVSAIEGHSVQLRKIISEKPTVLVFYRGGWCPYCNTHLGKLQSIESQIIEAGHQIIAISPDRSSNLRKSIEKGNLTYSLYSDSTMTVAKAFGLAFTVDNATVKKYKLFGINIEKASGETHHMLPVPAVFLVDTNGVIQYAFSNPDYKVRLETDEIIQLVEQSRGSK